MSQARTILLRLREADVVRICGFEAAARGLELASRHAVGHGKRKDSRLEAIVTDESECAVAVVLPADGAPRLIAWECSRDSSSAPPDGTTSAIPPGCAHVAAILTAWIRAPGDFAAPTDASTDAPRDAVRLPAPRPRLAQPPLLAPAPARRAHAGTSLADELARLPSAEAVAMARRILGVTTDEHEARVLLAGTLRDPKQVATLLSRLDPDAAVLLTDIELLGAAITAADLDALADRTGRSASALRTDLGVLERHGLVFRAAGATTSTGGEHTWRQFTGWRMPPEIRAAHSAHLPLSPLPTADPHGPPLLSILSGPSDAAAPERPRAARIQRGSPRPLYLALALLARAPRPYSPFATPTANADTSKPATSRADRQPFPLLVGELAQSVLAEFARSAGVPIGVARLARRLLLWAREAPDAAALLDMASVPSSERTLALLAGFRLWRNVEAPAELADLNVPESPIRVRFDLSHEALRPAALAAEAGGARSAILLLLERIEPGNWYTLDAFAQLVWRVAPLFLRSRQMTYVAPAWWLERRADGRPLRPTDHDEWRAGEGTYLRALLARTLSAWGAMDIALDTEKRPAAFRLTPFGHDLLAGSLSRSADSSIAPESEWGPPVLLTRDAALAVHPLAAGSSLLDALDQWARVTDIAGGRLVYTLDADRACAAFDRGIAPEALLASLRTLPHADRAAAVTRERLAVWRTRYGSSRIESGWTLLEARDEATLAEALAQAPEIAARARRLAPSLALAACDDSPVLRAALAKRGYSL
ncbi:MAG TPA: hypothetical protein VKQ30_19945 [Ktedonobacterales bacterium]|nr:hypothetical protein [Ktedonobacterales bacterium]